MARVWKFGTDVDTDQIVPGRYAPYMTSEEELGKYPFIEARPEFAAEVQRGDIIVRATISVRIVARICAPGIESRGIPASIAPVSPYLL